MTLFEKTIRRDSNSDKYESLQEAYMKVLNEEGTKFKNGDKVKFTDKDDDFYGKTGTIYKAFKGKGYTVKIGNKVVSRDDSELEKV